METRKLQQVGGGTYTVSIPKAWADEHRLEAGMELCLYTHRDGSIVLRAAERDGEALDAVTVEVPGEDPTLVERAIRSAHTAGFESVTLRPDGSFTRAQREAARSTVAGLVGTDLVVERDEEITVEHLLDATTVSVRQSVVRLQFTARSLHREAVEAFLAGDADAADRLVERGDEAARVARMVTRQFTRSLVSLGEVDRLGVPRPELFRYYVIARALGRVADQGVAIARLARRLEGPLPERVEAALGDASERALGAVDDATTAALEDAGAQRVDAVLGDHAAAVAAVEDADRALFDEWATELDGPTALAVGRALDRLGATADAGESVARVALRAAIRADVSDPAADASTEPAA
ncbi:MAG: AbrB/MazE/SpoVT family DNA-binding domain-containing protein [Halosimplex sp.]